MKTNSITGSSRVGLRDNDASASESLLGNNEHQPTKLNRSEMFSSLRDLSKPCGDGREIKVQFKAKSAPELNADSTADVHLPSTRNAEHVPEGVWRIPDPCRKEARPTGWNPRRAMRRPARAMVSNQEAKANG